MTLSLLPAKGVGSILYPLIHFLHTAGTSPIATSACGSNRPAASRLIRDQKYEEHYTKFSHSLTVDSFEIHQVSSFGNKVLPELSGSPRESGNSSGGKKGQGAELP
jgi:hypothetical protein